MTSYRLTPSGFEWGRTRDTNPNPATYNTSFFEKTQLILTNNFLGFFMIPGNHIWNYNFVGMGVLSDIQYGLIPGNPKEFYH